MTEHEHRWGFWREELRTFGARFLSRYCRDEMCNESEQITVPLRTEEETGGQ